MALNIHPTLKFLNTTLLIMLLSLPFLNHNHGLHLLLNAASHHSWDCFSLLVLTIAISTGLLSGKRQNPMIQENADSDDWKRNIDNLILDQNIGTADKNIRAGQKQEEETADAAGDRRGGDEDVLRESQCSNDVDESEQPQESIQGKALSLENRIDCKAEKIIRAEKEEEQISGAGDEKGAHEEPIHEGEEEDALYESQCSMADDSEQPQERMATALKQSSVVEVDSPANIHHQMLQERESCSSLLTTMSCTNLEKTQNSGILLRVNMFAADEEEEEGYNRRCSREVNEEADAFIRRFHERMRLQRIESMKRYLERLRRSCSC